MQLKIKFLSVKKDSQFFHIIIIQDLACPGKNLLATMGLQNMKTKLKQASFKVVNKQIVLPVA